MNFIKFTLVALSAFFIVYVATGQIEISNSLSTLIAEELPINIVESSISLEDSIVNFGMKLLGTPYVVAGCGIDGFDCSGFVNFVFQHYGIKVPRRSLDFEHFGTEIPIENVQKGDILIFISPTRNVIGHVGIVTNPKGMESDFIHAASGRDKKVKISRITTKGYTWLIAKAIRVL